MTSLKRILEIILNHFMGNIPEKMKKTLLWIFKIPKWVSGLSVSKVYSMLVGGYSTITKYYIGFFTVNFWVMLSAARTILKQRSLNYYNFVIIIAVLILGDLLGFALSEGQFCIIPGYIYYGVLPTSFFNCFLSIENDNLDTLYKVIRSVQDAAQSQDAIVALKSLNYDPYLKSLELWTQFAKEIKSLNTISSDPLSRLALELHHINLDIAYTLQCHDIKLSPEFLMELDAVPYDLAVNYKANEYTDVIVYKTDMTQLYCDKSNVHAKLMAEITGKSNYLF